MPAMNAPARINVPLGQSQTIVGKNFGICKKRGRPIGSKDSAPRTRRNERSSSCPPEEAGNPPKEVPLEETRNAPEEVMVKSIL